MGGGGGVISNQLIRARREKFVFRGRATGPGVAMVAWGCHEPKVAFLAARKARGAAGVGGL